MAIIHADFYEDEERPASLWHEAFDALTNEEQEELQAAHVDIAKRQLEPDHVINAVEEKRKECADKQWTIFTDRKGQKVAVRDVLDKMVGWLEKFKKLGDMAVQFDPMHAAIPWMAVRGLLTIAISDSQTFGAMAESLEEISKIIFRYAELEAKILIRTSNLTKQLAAALLKLYESSLRFLAQALAYYKKSTLRRALKSAFAGGKGALVEEPMLQVTKQEEEVLKLIYLVNNEITGVKLDQIIKGIKESIHEKAHQSTEERRKKFSAWINGISTKNTYETALQYHHAGTCEWALRLPEFESWESDTSLDPKLLWIHGPAGFGKTFISAWIIRHWEEHKETPISYFFCVAENHLTRDPYAILRSWLTNMLEQGGPIVQAMNKVYEARSAEQSLTHLGLWELFEAVGQAVDRCIFIVDGFDECIDIDTGARYHNNDPRNIFLRDLLKHLSKTSARVLVISRDVPDIRECLGRDASASVDECTNIEKLEYGITARDTTEDVQSFSEHIVNTKLAKRNLKIRQKIADQAAERSEGMFLWIKLLEREISPGKNAEQLEKSISQMPLGISDAYSRELERMIRMSPDDKAKAVMILRWVLFAVRPLQVKQLAEALVVSDEELDEYPEDELPDCWNETFVDEDYVKEMILSPCGSLLQLRSSSPCVPLADHTVHFVHFSVKEFLTKLSSSPDTAHLATNLGLMDPASEERRLSGICLRYLRLKTFESIPVDTEVYPFLSYAGWAWYFHSFFQKPAPTEDILRRTQMVFDPAVSSWRVWTPVLEAKLRYADSLNQGDGDHLGDDADSDRATSVRSLSGGGSDSGDPEAGFPQQVATPIYYASLLGLIDVVKWLEDRGLDYETAGGRYGFPLQAAVVGKHEEAVKHLLNRTVNVSQIGGQYGTALMAAAAVSTLEIVKLLLDAGADFKAANADGFTALHHAAKRGHVDIVHLLLDRGADINATTSSSITPVWLACFYRYIEVATFLIASGADLSIASDNKGARHTPFQVAIENSDLQIATLLLDKGVSPNQVVDDGGEASGRYWLLSPLQTAIINERFEIAEMLLKRGADLEQTTASGFTALLLAVYCDQIESVEWLLKAGASMKCIWEHSQDSLFDLVQETCRTKMRKLLVRCGCFRGEGRSGDIEERLAALRLEYDEDLNNSDNLPMLAYNGNTQGVEAWIAQQHIGSAAPDSLGEALRIASAQGHAGVVSVLLNHHAPVDGRDINNRTALHHAAKQLHLDVVDLLVSRGAEIQLQDNIGSTPIDLAIGKGQRALPLVQRHMDNFTLGISRRPSLVSAITPNKPTNLTVMGARKALAGSWTGHYEHLSWENGKKDPFSLDIPAQPPKDGQACTFAGEGKDAMGPFQFQGFVDPIGVVWFVKLYDQLGWLYRGQLDVGSGLYRGTWGSNRKLWFGTFELRRV